MAKTFTPTKDMISAAESVFAAMAMVATIKPVVQANQRKVFSENKIATGGKLVDKVRERGGSVPEFVENYGQLHYSTDEAMNIYLQKMYELNTQAGLQVETVEHCPLLVAENLLNRAENLLIDVMEPITQFNHDKVSYDLEIRAKAIDLTLRLLSPYVRDAKTYLHGIKKA